MTGSDKTIEHEALTWLVQVNDPGFENWGDWDDWMAADPRHQSAYWRLAEREADVTDRLRAAPRPTPAARPRREPRLRRQRLAFAAAAAFAVVGGATWALWNGPLQTRVVETGAGEPRTIVLADGSHVSLDGATRLTFDARRPRAVRLDAGRALFIVVHDPARPFSVTAGDTALTDLGTTFDVTRLDEGARVSVAEGVVRVEAGGRSTILRQGEGVLASRKGLDRRVASPEATRDWRSGRLTYVDEPLAIVGQDLARALGHPVRLGPGLDQRRFTGSLAVTAPQSELQTRLETLLNVSIVPEREGWRLEPRPLP